MKLKITFYNCHLYSEILIDANKYNIGVQKALQFWFVRPKLVTQTVVACFIALFLLYVTFCCLFTWWNKVDSILSMCVRRSGVLPGDLHAVQCNDRAWVGRVFNDADHRPRARPHVSLTLQPTPTFCHFATTQSHKPADHLTSSGVICTTVQSVHV